MGICIEEGCKKQPNFNVECEKKGLYCAQHRTEGMVIVTIKTCCEQGCKKQPNFNVECEKKGLYCAKHRNEGMVNVKDKTCCEQGCKKQPTFNVEGETKGLYCAQHRTAGMVNIKKKTCCEQGCKKRPTFNVEGETKGLYCAKHRTEGMVDVANKTCCEEGCKKIPTFNVEGETKGLYCAKHRTEGMVDVTNKTCCEQGCKKQPIFNVEGKTKGLYCAKHRNEGMVNVKDKTCKSDWCTIIVTNKTIKYDGYCFRCFMYLFPDKPISRNYKTKEFAVVEYIKNNFPDVDWIADRIVNGGCSKRRPDLILDLGYQLLLIEIDENKHSGYDCSCQNKRLMQLSQDVGHRPIIFIRFNPDAYTNNNGTKIKSCWTTNGYGICVVDKSKKTEWQERLDCLKDQVQYWINNRTDKTIETIQLFY
jgi:hypothetical protein